MLKHTFYTFAFAASILYSCQQNSPKEADAKVESQPPQKEALSFRTETVTRKSSYCAQDPKACAVATITFLNVVGGNGPLRQSIRKYISDQILSLQLDTNPEADTAVTGAIPAVTVAEAFIKQQEDFIIEMKEIPASAAWELQVLVSPVYQSPAVTTLAIKTYTYAGGAHPNSYLSLQSFDSSGRQLRINDIVTDTTHFQQLVEQEFRRTRSTVGDKPLAEAGLFLEGNTLPLPRQAGLTPQGLRLYYNAYEIGPYAFGPTDLLLTYQELGPLLRSKYKPSA
ncbi:DUF3298 and DUF4163 domain-containing protein [Pontibacter anaerobius]|uniref:DUF3298 domain-containing protein n=1 Tax=Pontibacter anaerobius TaxID=2993940 RepID=A0ABT3RCA4_9BACT|nr:DUF3298 and DUF4163 domain-containing protein [Pontibacter anaerobius]MCX2739074.1 DUF3298 domain-containing protein [Pontibacter anaerobius]